MAGSYFCYFRKDYGRGRYESQRRVKATLDKEQPMLLFWIPTPLSTFSILLNIVKAKGLTRKQKDNSEVELPEAIKHMSCCFKLYHKQRVGGRYDMPEHLQTASSLDARHAGAHHQGRQLPAG